MAKKILEKITAGIVAETTSMRIADILRNRILTGELAPGQRLKMEEVASGMGISTMPVREAFQVLEGEGALDIFPHRGAVVRRIDAEFINNIYDMRGALSAMLLERSIRRAGDGFVDELCRLNENYVRIAKTGDCIRIIDADAGFHGCVVEQARNGVAARVLAHGELMTRAIRRRLGYSREFLKRTIADHEDIISAVRCGDAETAGRLQRRHCDAARDDLLSLLEKRHD